MHGKVLTIMAGLYCDVHESINPVIEGNLMLIFNLSQFLSNKRCIHEEFILKLYVQ